MDKTTLREKALFARDSLLREESEEKSRAIQKNVLSLPVLSSARSIAAYLPFGSEVMTRLIIKSFWSAGKDVFLPTVNGSTLGFSRFLPSSRLEKVSLGFSQPAGGKSADPKQIGAFVVPGIAFGSAGERIGWGKGLYDRFFNEKKPGGPKVGICFSCQVLEGIPVEKHDVLMDFVVTEHGVLKPVKKNSSRQG